MTTKRDWSHDTDTYIQTQLAPSYFSDITSEDWMATDANGHRVIDIMTSAQVDALINCFGHYEHILFYGWDYVSDMDNFPGSQVQYLSNAAIATLGPRDFRKLVVGPPQPLGGPTLSCFLTPGQVYSMNDVEVRSTEMDLSPTSVNFYHTVTRNLASWQLQKYLRCGISVACALKNFPAQLGYLSPTQIFDVGLNYFDSSEIRLFTDEVIASLSYTQLKMTTGGGDTNAGASAPAMVLTCLTAAQVPVLSRLAILAMQDTDFGQYTYVNSVGPGAASGGNIANNLSPTQIGWLTLSQIHGINVVFSLDDEISWDVAVSYLGYFNTHQIQLMSPEIISNLNGVDFVTKTYGTAKGNGAEVASVLSLSQVNLLTADQIHFDMPAINHFGINCLSLFSDVQIKCLNREMVAGLTYGDLNTVTRDGHKVLTQLNSEQLGVIGNNQLSSVINGIQENLANLLESYKIKYLPRETVAAFTTASPDVFSLTTADSSAGNVLTVLSSLSWQQVAFLTATQLATFTTAEIRTINPKWFTDSQLNMPIAGTGNTVISALMGSNPLLNYASLSATVVGNLSASFIGTLTPAQIRMLDVSEMTAAQLGYNCNVSGTAQKVWDVICADPADTRQLAQLSAATIADLTEDDISALFENQVHALNIKNITVSGFTRWLVQSPPGTTRMDLCIRKNSAGNYRQLSELTAVEVGELDATFGTRLTLLSQINALDASGFSQMQLQFPLTLTDKPFQDLPSSNKSLLGALTIGGATKQLSRLSATAVGQLIPRLFNFFSVAQVQSLNVSQLTATKLAYTYGDTDNTIWEAILSGPDARQLTQLTPAAIKGLDATNLGLMSSTQVAALTQAQLEGLSAAQLQALNVSDLSVAQSKYKCGGASGTQNILEVILSDTNPNRGLQISQLNGDVIASFTDNQIANLSSAEMLALDSSQLNLSQLEIPSERDGVCIEALASDDVTGRFYQMSRWSASLVSEFNQDDFNWFYIDGAKALKTDRINYFQLAYEVEGQDVFYTIYDRPNGDGLANLSKSTISQLQQTHFTRLNQQQVQLLDASALTYSQLGYTYGGSGSTTTVISAILDKIDAIKKLKPNVVKQLVDASGTSPARIGLLTTLQQMQALDLRGLTTPAQLDTRINGTYSVWDAIIANGATYQLSQLSADVVKGTLTNNIRVGGLDSTKLNQLSIAQIQSLVAISRTQLRTSYPVSGIVGSTVWDAVIANGAAHPLHQLSNILITRLTTAELAKLSAMQVGALSNYEFGLLSKPGVQSLNIRALSYAQLSLPLQDGYTVWDSVISNSTNGYAQLGLLSAKMVALFTASDFLRLTTAEQVNALQVDNLSYAQLQYYTYTGGSATEANAKQVWKSIAENAGTGSSYPQLKKLNDRTVRQLTKADLQVFTTAAQANALDVSSVSYTQLNWVIPISPNSKTFLQIILDDSSNGYRQLGQLSPSVVAEFTSAQINNLTAAQVQSLDVSQLSYTQLTTSISGASTTVLNAILATNNSNRSKQLSELNQNAISQFTQNEFTLFSKADVQLLNGAGFTYAQMDMAPNNVSSVWTAIHDNTANLDQLQNLSVNAFLAWPSPGGTAGLTSSQIAVLGADLVNTLTASVELTTEQFQAIEPYIFPELTDDFLRTLSDEQVYNLLPDQLAFMTPEQISLVEGLNGITPFFINAATLTTSSTSRVLTTAMNSSNLTNTSLRRFHGQPLAIFTLPDAKLTQINIIGLIQTSVEQFIVTDEDELDRLDSLVASRNDTYPGLFKIIHTPTYPKLTIQNTALNGANAYESIMSLANLGVYYRDNMVSDITLHQARWANFASLRKLEDLLKDFVEPDSVSVLSSKLNSAKKYEGYLAAIKDNLLAARCMGAVFGTTQEWFSGIYIASQKPFSLKVVADVFSATGSLFSGLQVPNLLISSESYKQHSITEGLYNTLHRYVLTTGLNSGVTIGRRYQEYRTIQDAMPVVAHSEWLVTNNILKDFIDTTYWGANNLLQAPTWKQVMRFLGYYVFDSCKWLSFGLQGFAAALSPRDTPFRDASIAINLAGFLLSLTWGASTFAQSQYSSHEGEGENYAQAAGMRIASLGTAGAYNTFHLLNMIYLEVKDSWNQPEVSIPLFVHNIVRIAIMAVRATTIGMPILHATIGYVQFFVTNYSVQATIAQGRMRADAVTFTNQHRSVSASIALAFADGIWWAQWPVVNYAAISLVMSHVTAVKDIMSRNLLLGMQEEFSWNNNEIISPQGQARKKQYSDIASAIGAAKSDDDLNLISYTDIDVGSSLDSANFFAVDSLDHSFQQLYWSSVTVSAEGQKVVSDKIDPSRTYATDLGLFANGEATQTLDLTGPNFGNDKSDVAVINIDNTTLNYVKKYTLNLILHDCGTSVNLHTDHITINIRVLNDRLTNIINIPPEVDSSTISVNETRGSAEGRSLASADEVVPATHMFYGNMGRDGVRFQGRTQENIYLNNFSGLLVEGNSVGNVVVGSKPVQGYKSHTGVADKITMTGGGGYADVFSGSDVRMGGGNNLLRVSLGDMATSGVANPASYFDGGASVAGEYNSDGTVFYGGLNEINFQPSASGLKINIKDPNSTSLVSTVTTKDSISSNSTTPIDSGTFRNFHVVTGSDSGDNITVQDTDNLATLILGAGINVVAIDKSHGIQMQSVYRGNNVVSITNSSTVNFSTTKGSTSYTMLGSNSSLNAHFASPSDVLDVRSDALSVTVFASEGKHDIFFEPLTVTTEDEDEPGTFSSDIVSGPPEAIITMDRSAEGVEMKVEDFSSREKPLLLNLDRYSGTELVNIDLQNHFIKIYTNDGSNQALTYYNIAIGADDDIAERDLLKSVAIGVYKDVNCSDFIAINLFTLLDEAPTGNITWASKLAGQAEVSYSLSSLYESAANNYYSIDSNGTVAPGVHRDLHMSKDGLVVNFTDVNSNSTLSMSSNSTLNLLGNQTYVNLHDSGSDIVNLYNRSPSSPATAEFEGGGTINMNNSNQTIQLYGGKSRVTLGTSLYGSIVDQSDGAIITLTGGTNPNPGNYFTNLTFANVLGNSTNAATTTVMAPTGSSFAELQSPKNIVSGLHGGWQTVGSATVDVCTTGFSSLTTTNGSGTIGVNYFSNQDASGINVTLGMANQTSTTSGSTVLVGNNSKHVSVNDRDGGSTIIITNNTSIRVTPNITTVGVLGTNNVVTFSSGSAKTVSMLAGNQTVALNGANLSSQTNVLGNLSALTVTDAGGNSTVVVGSNTSFNLAARNTKVNVTGAGNVINSTNASAKTINLLAGNQVLALNGANTSSQTNIIGDLSALTVNDIGGNASISMLNATFATVIGTNTTINLNTTGAGNLTIAGGTGLVVNGLHGNTNSGTSGFVTLTGANTSLTANSSGWVGLKNNNESVTLKGANSTLMFLSDNLTGEVITDIGGGANITMSNASRATVRGTNTTINLNATGAGNLTLSGTGNIVTGLHGNSNTGTDGYVNLLGDGSSLSAYGQGVSRSGVSYYGWVGLNASNQSLTLNSPTTTVTLMAPNLTKLYIRDVGGTSGINMSNGSSATVVGNATSISFNVTGSGNLTLSGANNKVYNLHGNTNTGPTSAFVTLVGNNTSANTYSGSGWVGLNGNSQVLGLNSANSTVSFVSDNLMNEQIADLAGGANITMSSNSTATVSGTNTTINLNTTGAGNLTISGGTGLVVNGLHGNTNSGTSGFVTLTGANTSVTANNSGWVGLKNNNQSVTLKGPGSTVNAVTGNLSGLTVTDMGGNSSATVANNTTLTVAPNNTTVGVSGAGNVLTFSNGNAKTVRLLSGNQVLALNGANTSSQTNVLGNLSALTVNDIGGNASVSMLNATFATVIGTNTTINLNTTGAGNLTIAGGTGLVVNGLHGNTNSGTSGFVTLTGANTSVTANSTGWVGLQNNNESVTLKGANSTVMFLSDNLAGELITDIGGGANITMSNVSRATVLGTNTKINLNATGAGNLTLSGAGNIVTGLHGSTNTGSSGYVNLLGDGSSLSAYGNGSSLNGWVGLNASNQSVIVNGAVTTVTLMAPNLTNLYIRDVGGTSGINMSNGSSASVVGSYTSISLSPTGYGNLTLSGANNKVYNLHGNTNTGPTSAFVTLVGNAAGAATYGSGWVGLNGNSQVLGLNGANSTVSFVSDNLMNEQIYDLAGGANITMSNGSSAALAVGAGTTVNLNTTGAGNLTIAGGTGIVVNGLHGNTNSGTSGFVTLTGANTSVTANSSGWVGLQNNNESVTLKGANSTVMFLGNNLSGQVIADVAGGGNITMSSGSSATVRGINTTINLNATGAGNLTLSGTGNLVNGLHGNTNSGTSGFVTLVGDGASFTANGTAWVGLSDNNQSVTLNGANSTVSVVRSNLIGENIIDIGGNSTATIASNTTLTVAPNNTTVGVTGTGNVLTFSNGNAKTVSLLAGNQTVALNVANVSSQTNVIGNLGALTVADTGGNSSVVMGKNIGYLLAANNTTVNVTDTGGQVYLNNANGRATFIGKTTNIYMQASNQTATLNISEEITVNASGGNGLITLVNASARLNVAPNNTTVGVVGANKTINFTNGNAKTVSLLTGNQTVALNGTGISSQTNVIGNLSALTVSDVVGNSTVLLTNNTAVSLLAKNTTVNATGTGDVIKLANTDANVTVNDTGGGAVVELKSNTALTLTTQNTTVNVTGTGGSIRLINDGNSSTLAGSATFVGQAANITMAGTYETATIKGIGSLVSVGSSNAMRYSGIDNQTTDATGITVNLTGRANATTVLSYPTGGTVADLTRSSSSSTTRTIMGGANTTSYVAIAQGNHIVSGLHGAVPNLNSAWMDIATTGTSNVTTTNGSGWIGVNYYTNTDEANITVTLGQNGETSSTSGSTVEVGNNSQHITVNDNDGGSTVKIKNNTVLTVSPINTSVGVSGQNNTINFSNGNAKTVRLLTGNQVLALNGTRVSSQTNVIGNLSALTVTDVVGNSTVKVNDNVSLNLSAVNTTVNVAANCINNVVNITNANAIANIYDDGGTVNLLANNQNITLNFSNAHDTTVNASGTGDVLTLTGTTGNANLYGNALTVNQKNSWSYAKFWGAGPYTDNMLVGGGCIALMSDGTTVNVTGFGLSYCYLNVSNQTLRMNGTSSSAITIASNLRNVAVSDGGTGGSNLTVGANTTLSVSVKGTTVNVTGAGDVIKLTNTDTNLTVNDTGGGAVVELKSNTALTLTAQNTTVNVTGTGGLIRLINDGNSSTLAGSATFVGQAANITMAGNYETATIRGNGSLVSVGSSNAMRYSSIDNQTTDATGITVNVTGRVDATSVNAYGTGGTVVDLTRSSPSSATRTIIGGANATSYVAIAQGKHLVSGLHGGMNQVGSAYIDIGTTGTCNLTTTNGSGWIGVNYWALTDTDESNITVTLGNGSPTKTSGSIVAVGNGSRHITVNDFDGSSEVDIRCNTILGVSANNTTVNVTGTGDVINLADGGNISLVDRAYSSSTNVGSNSNLTLNSAGHWETAPSFNVSGGNDTINVDYGFAQVRSLDASGALKINLKNMAAVNIVGKSGDHLYYNGYSHLSEKSTITHGGGVIIDATNSSVTGYIYNGTYHSGVKSFTLPSIALPTASYIYSDIDYGIVLRIETIVIPLAGVNQLVNAMAAVSSPDGAASGLSGTQTSTPTNALLVVSP